MLQLNVPYHQVTSKTLITEIPISHLEWRKNTKKSYSKRRSIDNPWKTLNFFLVICCKITCFETVFSLDQCFVYTLSLQLRLKALARIARVVFSTLQPRTRMHTHTCRWFSEVFFEQNIAIQKSVPLFKKWRQVTQLLWLCSLCKCQCCTATEVGLVRSARGSINLVITKI